MQVDARSGRQHVADQDRSRLLFQRADEEVRGQGHEQDHQPVGARGLRPLDEERVQGEQQPGDQARGPAEQVLPQHGHDGHRQPRADRAEAANRGGAVTEHGHPEVQQHVVEALWGRRPDEAPSGPRRRLAA